MITFVAVLDPSFRELLLEWLSKGNAVLPVSSSSYKPKEGLSRSGDILWFRWHKHKRTPSMAAHPADGLSCCDAPLKLSGDQGLRCTNLLCTKFFTE